MGVSLQEYINRYGSRPGQATTTTRVGSLRSTGTSGGQYFAVKVEGFDDLAQKLRAIAPAMRRRVLGNALRAGARVVRDEAKRLVPVLRPGAAVSSPFRGVGTVKKAIKVRTSKADRKEGNVGVFVNVKPAKSGQRGAKSPNDPFYWRFLELGTKKMTARPFLRPAAGQLDGALKVFQSKMTEWFKKAEDTGKITP